MVQKSGLGKTSLTHQSVSKQKSGLGKDQGFTREKMDLGTTGARVARAMLDGMSAPAARPTASGSGPSSGGRPTGGKGPLFGAAAVAALRQRRSSDNDSDSVSDTTSDNASLDSWRGGATGTRDRQDRSPNKTGRKRAKKGKGCNCSRSQCVKMYCECFAKNVRLCPLVESQFFPPWCSETLFIFSPNQAYCNPECQCLNCVNDGKPANRAIREKAIKHIVKKTKTAFTKYQAFF